MIDLFPYPPLPDTLALVASLSEDKFRLLLEEITGPQAFERDIDRCTSLSESLGQKNISDVYNLLSSLNFLYVRCRELEASDIELTAGLREFLEISELISEFGEDTEKGFKRIVQLVKRNTTLEQKRKLRWLRTGILENAVEFSSFVDIRPSFSEDRKIIETFIPIIILRIGTESDQRKDQSYVFQLTENGLKKLREAIDDIAMKLSTVQTDTKLGDRIHKDTK